MAFAVPLLMAVAVGIHIKLLATSCESNRGGQDLPKLGGNEWLSRAGGVAGGESRRDRGWKGRVVIWEAWLELGT